MLIGRLSMVFPKSDCFPVHVHVYLGGHKLLVGCDYLITVHVCHQSSTKEGSTNNSAVQSRV